MNEAIIDRLAFVYFGVFAIGFAFNQLFRSRLRNNHPETWEQLGSPGFLNNSLANGLKTMGFLLRGRYRQLGDSTLTLYGNVARAGFLGVVAFLLIFLGASLFILTKNGVWNNTTSESKSLGAAGIVLVALVVAHLAIVVFLQRFLRAVYPALWRELGEPTFLNTNFSNVAKMRRFVWSERYEQFNDWRLGIFIWLDRLTTIALVVMVVASVLDVFGH